MEEQPQQVVLIQKGLLKKLTNTLKHCKVIEKLPPSPDSLCDSIAEALKQFRTQLEI